VIGRRLNHYEIVEKLGEGGMGEVWLARDTRLGRKVALKSLSREFAEQPQRLRRFEQEARAIASLNHPNVVTLYSVEQIEGQHILTMEYVEGVTLDELIPDEGQRIEAFFSLALPIAEAIDAAHRRGIAHRDLKPGNIMVTGDGRVKVLDFGLSRRLPGEDDETFSQDDVETRTQEGVVAGTPPYMSPEQIRGGDADHRSDLFSLGIVFHEMLAGSRPFAGPSAAVLASAILRDDPPDLATVRSDLPPRLPRLIRRCLEKDPGRRMGSAEELVGELNLSRTDATGGGVASNAKIIPGAATAGRAIAVADFENIAGDHEVDWLSGGIAETISVDLKRLTALRMVSRNEVVRAWEEVLNESGGRDIALLGSRLGVDVLICGGFQKHGDTVRVTSQVTEVATGDVIGSFKADGSAREIFDLQDRVVEELMRILDVSAVSGKEQAVRPSTGQLEAFECYAKGRWHVQRMNVSDFGKARELLTRAIEIDPDYALAHAGLGELFSLTYIATTDPEDLEIAVNHLQRAAALDPKLHEPHAWLAYSLMRAGRLDEAVASGRRAVSLDPEDSQSHYFLGIALWVKAGKEHFGDPWPELIGELGESARLTPRYQAASQMMGVALMFRGRYAEARAALERAADIEASDDFELGRFVGAHAMLARLSLRQDMVDDALRLGRRSLEILRDRDHVYTAAMLALSHGVIGDALQRLGRPEAAVSEYRSAIEIATAHPRSLGVGAVLVRSRLGLARCFQALRTPREAMILCEDATDLFRGRKGFDFSWTADVTDADLYIEMAMYHAVSKHDAEALDAIEMALRSGWGDFRLLENQPEFSRLRDRPDFGSRISASPATPP
jgi:serine/threonine protein kinase/tetratricopeptide (TPR) repeat protein